MSVIFVETHLGRPQAVVALQHILLETHLPVKSSEISFAHNLLLSCEIVLTLCTEHDCVSVVLCANFGNDFTTEIDVLDERNFTRFEFKRHPPPPPPPDKMTAILHYDDVTMSAMSSQITSLTIVCSIVYSGTDQRKNQNSSSLASSQRASKAEMFPSDDVIVGRRQF